MKCKENVSLTFDQNLKLFPKESSILVCSTFMGVQTRGKFKFRMYFGRTHRNHHFSEEVCSMIMNVWALKTFNIFMERSQFTQIVPPYEHRFRLYHRRRCITSCLTGCAITARNCSAPCVLSSQQSLSARAARSRASGHGQTTYKIMHYPLTGKHLVNSWCKGHWRSVNSNALTPPRARTA